MILIIFALRFNFFYTHRVIGINTVCTHTHRHTQIFLYVIHLAMYFIHSVNYNGYYLFPPLSFSFPNTHAHMYIHTCIHTTHTCSQIYPMCFAKYLTQAILSVNSSSWYYLKNGAAASYVCYPSVACISPTPFSSEIPEIGLKGQMGAEGRVA